MSPQYSNAGHAGFQGVEFEEYSATTLKLKCHFCPQTQQFHQYTEGESREGQREKLLGKAMEDGWNVYDGDGDVEPFAACSRHKKQFDHRVENGD